MIWFRVLILNFMIILLTAPSGYGAESVIVNKDFNGREIKVRTGGTVQVELEQAGAAGYTWEVQDLDQKYFELLGVETRGRPEPGALQGAPVLKVWRFRAKKEGKSELRFLHYRPWEGEKKAAESFHLKVRIL
jgi:predicted secreted protein